MLPAHQRCRQWFVVWLRTIGITDSCNTLAILLTVANAESELNTTVGYADLEGARLDRQQGDSLSLKVDYLIEALNINLHWDVLTVDDVDAGLDLDGVTLDNKKNGYTIHNITARWSPKPVPGLVLTAGVDNLMDEYYASQSSRTGTSFHPLFGLSLITI